MSRRDSLWDDRRTGWIVPIPIGLPVALIVLFLLPPMLTSGLWPLVAVLVFMWIAISWRLNR